MWILAQNGTLLNAELATCIEHDDYGVIEAYYGGCILTIASVGRKFGPMVMEFIQDQIEDAEIQLIDVKRFVEQYLANSEVGHE